MSTDIPRSPSYYVVILTKREPATFCVADTRTSAGLVFGIPSKELAEQIKEAIIAGWWDGRASK